MRTNMKTDIVATAARAAARQLESESIPGLPSRVELALAESYRPGQPAQYVDPTSLASLIVSIASLTWTIYADLKKDMKKPAKQEVNNRVLKELGQATVPDYIIDVVVTETIKAAEQKPLD
jgi:hypothetical protein